MTIVLDASALLCLLLKEPGYGRIGTRAEGAAISAINLSEVFTRLIDLGEPDSSLDGIVDSLRLRVVPFIDLDARRVALLRARTRFAGLSLADHACLALADALSATVLTTDRNWSRLDLGIAVEQLR